MAISLWIIHVVIARNICYSYGIWSNPIKNKREIAIGFSVVWILLLILSGDLNHTLPWLDVFSCINRMSLFPLHWLPVNIHNCPTNQFCMKKAAFHNGHESTFGMNALINVYSCQYLWCFCSASKTSRAGVFEIQLMKKIGEEKTSAKQTVSTAAG